LTRIKTSLWVDEDLWGEIKRLAFQKHENFHGAITAELEEALLNWVRLHTQNHTKQLAVNKVNPNPRVYRVFQEVKEHVKERYGYAALPSGQQVPRSHLTVAIGAVRGDDPRTVKKWMKSFERFKLIKWIAGELWEIV